MPRSQRIGLSTALIPEMVQAPGSDINMLRFRYVISDSFSLVFTHPTWHLLALPFPLTLTTHALYLRSLEVVWNQLLSVESERPTLISYAAWSLRL